MNTLAKIGALLLSSAFLGQLSLADTEFEDAIPIATVEALFDVYNDSQFAVYSDIAEDFPDFSIPPEFSVVGSVYQMSSLRVVFETDLPEEAALQAMTEVFLAQGWIDFPSARPDSFETGFVSERQVNIARSDILCHDDLGNLSLRYAEKRGRNFLSAGISLYRGRQQGNCEQQIAMQQTAFTQMGRSRGLRQYLPRMEIPASQTVPRGPVFIGGGSSSSGNTVATDGIMKSDQGIEEVYELFAEQIEAQGWELDSEAVGSRSATGTWLKSPEANLSLLGSLSVLDAGESEFQLEFRLSAEGFTGNNSAIFSPIGLPNN